MPDRRFGGALRPLGVALAALFAAHGSACRRAEPEGTRSQAARASASATARPSARPHTLVAPAAKAPCRVGAGTGTLEAPAQPLRARSELDGKRFVSLAAGERLSVRHERTTRELTLAGPGRFLPCARGEEQVLVVEGGVTSALGVGAHAGGEVVIATPFGLVRYADAAVDVKVAPSRLSLRVAAGDVVFDAPPGKPGAEPKPKTLRGPKGILDATKRADAALTLERCLSARATSQKLEKPPRPSGSARAPLGSWAVASFEARRGARLACALARAVIAGLPEPERRRLEDQLESPNSAGGSSTRALPAEKK